MIVGVILLGGTRIQGLPAALADIERDHDVTLPWRSAARATSAAAAGRR